MLFSIIYFLIGETGLIRTGNICRSSTASYSKSCGWIIIKCLHLKDIICIFLENMMPCTAHSRLKKAFYYDIKIVPLEFNRGQMRYFDCKFYIAASAWIFNLPCIFEHYFWRRPSGVVVRLAGCYTKRSRVRIPECQTVRPKPHQRQRSKTGRRRCQVHFSVALVDLAVRSFPWFSPKLA